MYITYQNRTTALKSGPMELPNELPNDQPKNVWCTLVMLNDKYAVGAAAVAKTARDVGSKYPVWCMVAGNVSEACVEFIGRHVDRVIRVPLLSAEVVKLRAHKADSIYSSWIGNSFTKWQCLNPEWFGGHKVCFLDADMIFRQNIDDVFDLPAPAMTFSTPWAWPYLPTSSRAAPIYNPFGKLVHGATVAPSAIARGLRHGIVGISPMVLLEPSAEAYAEVLRRLSMEEPYGHASCANGHDEQMLAELVISVWKTAVHISPVYNWVVGKTAWLEPGEVPRTYTWYNSKPWESRPTDDHEWPDIKIWWEAVADLYVEEPEWFEITW